MCINNTGSCIFYEVNDMGSLLEDDTLRYTQQHKIMHCSSDWKSNSNSVCEYSEERIHDKNNGKNLVAMSF